MTDAPNNSLLLAYAPPEGLAFQVAVGGTEPVLFFAAFVCEKHSSDGGQLECSSCTSSIMLAVLYEQDAAEAKTHSKSYRNALRERSSWP
jgi:hypothetical protein